MSEWQKSSFSGGNALNCIEVGATATGGIALRESEEPGVVVTTTPDNLRAFIKGVKAGEFDRFLSQDANIPARTPAPRAAPGH
ncbi:DUF397 domain-containing protein [Streptomyces sp. NPDC007088]|uniref:DUF397 domain-containing protein n=1 Tax=Streptomyces sp. NPDC007088 TaxID=3364773 RepID=UPI0036D149D9